MHNPINKEKIELVVKNAMPKGISGLLAALRQTQELLCTHLLTAAGKQKATQLLKTCTPS